MKFFRPDNFIVANAVVLFFSVLVAGCGNASHGETNLKAEVKAAAAPAKPLQETSNYIPAMYLKRSEFLDSNSIKYKDKLVLRLSLQKDSNRYLLAVSPTGKSGKILDSTSIKYPQAFINELAAPSAGTDPIFEEQHTKENDFQKLWNEINKYKLVNYILFEPVLDSNRHFCYKITGVEKLPADVSEAHGFATKTYYSHPSSHAWK